MVEGGEKGRVKLAILKKTAGEIGWQLSIEFIIAEGRHAARIM